jgi:hypothetical protein
VSRDSLTRRRSKENLEEKAIRYLAEGRVKVTKVDDERKLIVAEVAGTDTVYFTGYDPRKDAWACTCEANAKFRRRCSHIAALQLITRRPT